MGNPPRSLQDLLLKKDIGELKEFTRIHNIKDNSVSSKEEIVELILKFVKEDSGAEYPKIVRSFYESVNPPENVIAPPMKNKSKIRNPHRRHKGKSGITAEGNKRRRERNYRNKKNPYDVPTVKFVPIREGNEIADTIVGNATKGEITEITLTEKIGNLEYYRRMAETRVCNECKEKTLLGERCMNPDCNYREKRIEFNQ